MRLARHNMDNSPEMGLSRPPAESGFPHQQHQYSRRGERGQPLNPGGGPEEQGEADAHDERRGEAAFPEHG